VTSWRIALVCACVLTGCRHSAKRFDPIVADDAASKTVSAVDLCLQVERALLLYRDRCDALLLWEGPIDRAVEELRPSCEMETVAPGARRDPHQAATCIAALAQASCWEPAPAACSFHGSLRDGDSCAFDAQCAKSSFCAREKGACGRCKRAPRVDEPCKPFECDDGLKCIDGICSVPNRLGEPCTRNACAGYLRCLQEKGGYRCGRGASEGEACHPKYWTGAKFHPAVDCQARFLCDDGRCVKRSVKEVGEACSTFSECPSWACLAGHCIPRSKAGVACSGVNTGPCERSLDCIDDKCVLVDARACR
jgi:hypothetical protein